MLCLQEVKDHTDLILNNEIITFDSYCYFDQHRNLIADEVIQKVKIKTFK